MKAMNACVIDDEEPIDPPERETTPVEEERAAMDWYYGVGSRHRTRFTCALEFETEFEALCDAAFDGNN